MPAMFNFLSSTRKRQQSDYIEVDSPSQKRARTRSTRSSVSVTSKSSRNLPTTPTPANATRASRSPQSTSSQATAAVAEDLGSAASQNADMPSDRPVSHTDEEYEDAMDEPTITVSQDAGGPSVHATIHAKPHGSASIVAADPSNGQEEVIIVRSRRQTGAKNNGSDKNKSDKNKSDRNKSDKNKSDKNKSDKNKSDKNKFDKTSSDNDDDADEPAILKHRINNSDDVELLVRQGNQQTWVLESALQEESLSDLVAYWKSLKGGRLGVRQAYEVHKIRGTKWVSGPKSERKALRLVVEWLGYDDDTDEPWLKFAQDQPVLFEEYFAKIEGQAKTGK